MLRRGRGHVINVSASIADRPRPGTPALLAALTKGGLATAARSLAVEYADRGIRVNAVAPGEIATGLHPASDGGGGAGPLEPIGQVSDVVDAILYLESAPHVTGEILHIDGGH